MAEFILLCLQSSENYMSTHGGKVLDSDLGVIVCVMLGVPTPVIS